MFTRRERIGPFLFVREPETSTIDCNFSKVSISTDCNFFCRFDDEEDPPISRQKSYVLSTQIWNHSHSLFAGYSPLWGTSFAAFIACESVGIGTQCLKQITGRTRL